MKLLTFLRVHRFWLVFVVGAIFLPSPGRAATPVQIAQQAYLKASNTGDLDQFGFSVAISGDTVIVGAPHESSNAIGVNDSVNDTNDLALGAGAVYVFVRSGESWS
ncbi:MAG: FG-GAP repeat protein [Verrucomicrobiota bacterium]